MNKYGLLAQEHWQRYAPNRYASLDNPQEYFAQLGEAISNEIEAISDHLQRQLPKNLEFMDRLGQMNMIRHQAEETVLGELVYSVETETDIFEELDQMLGLLPSPEGIRASLRQIEDNAESEAEIEGWEEPGYSQDELAIKEWAHKIIPLLEDAESRLEDMTEAEARNRVLELRNLPHPLRDYLDPM